MEACFSGRVAAGDAAQPPGGCAGRRRRRHAATSKTPAVAALTLCLLVGTTQSSYNKPGSGPKCVSKAERGLRPDAVQWYVMTDEDLPTKYQKTFGQQFKDSVYHDYGTGPCRGDPVRGAPDMYNSNDEKFRCVMLHYLYASPLRTYCYEEADFVVMPQDPPAYNGEALRTDWPAMGWRGGEKPHVSLIPRPYIQWWKDAVYYARTALANHTLLIQQYPGWIFHGSRIEHHGHDLSKYPDIAELKPVFLGAPWVVKTFLTPGSARLGLQFDEDAVFARKRVFLRSVMDPRNWYRKVLHAQCQAAGAAACNHTTFPVDKALSDDERAQLWQPYRDAWYCLMPHGDEVVRTAMFDCMLQDAIPVVPHDYDWFASHLPFGDVIDWRRAAVFLRNMDEAAVKAKHNWINELRRQHSADDAMARVRYIRSIAHILQYSRYPMHGAVRWSQIARVHPMDDAFTSTIKALMRSLCKRGLVRGAHKCPHAHGGRWGRGLAQGVLGGAFEGTDL